MMSIIIDESGNEFFINLNDVSCVRIISGESMTPDSQLYTVFITFKHGHSVSVVIRGDNAYIQVLNMLRGEKS